MGPGVTRTIPNLKSVFGKPKTCCDECSAYTIRLIEMHGFWLAFGLRSLTSPVIRVLWWDFFGLDRVPSQADWPLVLSVLDSRIERSPNGGRASYLSFFFLHSPTHFRAPCLYPYSPPRGLATSLDKDIFFLRHPFGWHDQYRVLASVTFHIVQPSQFQREKLSSERSQGA